VKILTKKKPSAGLSLVTFSLVVWGAVFYSRSSFREAAIKQIGPPTDTFSEFVPNAFIRIDSDASRHW
jgi:hypothetical protein